MTGLSTLTKFRAYLGQKVRLDCIKDKSGTNYIWNKMGQD